MDDKDGVRVAIRLDIDTLKLLDDEVARMEVERPGLRVTRTSAIRVCLMDGLRGAQDRKLSASKAVEVDRLRDLIAELQVKNATPVPVVQVLPPRDPALCELEEVGDLCRKCKREMTLQDFRKGRTCAGIDLGIPSGPEHATSDLPRQVS